MKMCRFVVIHFYILHTPCLPSRLRRQSSFFRRQVEHQQIRKTGCPFHLKRCHIASPLCFSYMSLFSCIYFAFFPSVGNVMKERIHILLALFFSWQRCKLLTKKRSNNKKIRSWYQTISRWPPSYVHPLVTARIDCAICPQRVYSSPPFYVRISFLSFHVFWASIAKFLEKRLKEKTFSLTEMQRSIKFLVFDGVSVEAPPPLPPQLGPSRFEQETKTVEELRLSLASRWATDWL